MINSIASSTATQGLSGSSATSSDDQIQALNAQIAKLRAQIDEETKSKDDAKTKAQKLNQIQQKIIALEARIARIKAQKTSRNTYTTKVDQPAETSSSSLYGHIDVYAFSIENEDDLR